MNSNRILIFIYNLVEKGIKIWIKNEKIELFVPDFVNFPEIEKNFIRYNKDKIFYCLKLNNISSGDYEYIILKSDLECYPLSFAQERLWFIEKYEQGTSAYNVPMIFKISETTNLATLELSFKSIVARHEILRTLIKQDDEGNAYSYVMDAQKFDLNISKIKIRNESALKQEISRSLNHVYDLSCESPIRIRMYEVIKGDGSCKEYYVEIIIHHIAFDGWSAGVFLRELEDYYHYHHDHLQGKKSPLNLSELSIQYKDFALWQREYLAGDRLKTQLSYWKNKLDGYETLNLITDKPRSSQIDYKGEDIHFEVDEETSVKLRELSKELKVSLYSVLLAGYCLMLRSYSNQNDIVVGTPVANRHYSQIENLIGFFVNTLALRIQINSSTSVKEYIQGLGRDVQEAQMYQDLPFEKLVEELKVDKDTSRHPIFQVMFSVENGGGQFSEQTTSELEGAELLQPYIGGTEVYKVAKFDISTSIDDSQTKLVGSFNYATSIYNEATISQLIETYIHILKEFADFVDDSQRQEQTKVAELTYLTSEQYQQIIYEWNATEKAYPTDKKLQSLFEEQVEKTPENIALIYEGTKLTYRELNERSNQLAHYILQNQTINPDTLIALCLDRSEHILIAILSVLKAGGAYVPIDPHCPDERIKYILKDTNTKLVLTNALYQQKLEAISGVRLASTIAEENNQTKVLAIDSRKLQEQLLLQPTITPEIATKNTDLAYVIYTSGTTGQPKGVMIEHKGIVNLVLSMQRIYGLSKDDSFLFYRSYVFDGSVEETVLPLIIGGKLSICPTGISDLGRFLKTLEENYVSIINLNSETAEVIGSHITQNFSLKKIIAGGTKLKLKSFSYFLEKNVTVFNTYGPTECTVNSTFFIVDYVGNEWIGKPISNTRCYVLDRDLNPLPIGAIGELYIGGVGLARGYLNQPELTTERFIDNPFQTEKEKTQQKNARLYKTGDLVRWCGDGNLEYIGRNDFQVKIRGYRIELGEIESALSSYDGIKQSVVLAKDRKDSDGKATENKYLVGYYVSEGPLDAQKIQVYLQTKMPDYMVPSAFVHLEELPLTINGKLDRKALPDPSFTNQKTYVAPRNELERRVVEIWTEVLGLSKETLGIQDDFFRVGGNSILAIKLISRINKELNKHLPVASLFKHTTIERLSSFLDEASEEVIVINRSEVSSPEDQRLSFAQERLWFIEKYEQGTSAYNIPMVFKISEAANIDVLELSFKSIFARHEILRTLIKEDDEGNAYQAIIDYKDNPLEIQKIKVRDQGQLGEKLRKEINHIYDLSQEYPIRICLYKCGSEEKQHQEDYLSILIHHIAFDGWSVEIFLEELEVYYNYHLEVLKGKEAPLALPQLSIQYKDFALWQREYLRGERLTRDLNYWKSKLDGYETLTLTTDKPRPSQTDYKGADISFEIDEETSESLRSLAKKLSVSLYGLLLSGYYLMLRSYSNQEDIVIGTPIANRHYGQIENLIGFFVNTLALRVKIDSKQTLKDYIQGLGRDVQEAQMYQDLPFEKLVEELKVDKDTSRHPIFQTMFGLESFEENKSKKREQGSNDLKDILEDYKGKGADYAVAKFDLSTFIDDTNVKLVGNFNYAESLYREETVRRYMETYIHILRQLSELSNNLIKQEKTKIHELSYLSKSQYVEIIERWNETDREYPDDKTIQGLFEEQVEKTPENIALIYEGTKLTYRELNERSNQLAHYILQNQTINPDTLIALCLDRSEHMVIGILAVLKAGAGYVPMDPSYPDSRIEYMLEDTNASIVLTNESHKQRLDGIVRSRASQFISCDERFERNKEVVEVLAIDDSKVQGLLSEQSLFNPETETASRHLAYVIYTSGTTGNPKGVMIEHKSVVNSSYAAIKHRGIINSSKVLQTASYSFDSSVLEIYPTLFTGAVLFINEDIHKNDINLIHNYCIKNKITKLFLTTKLGEEFLHLENDKLDLTDLVLAGEKLKPIKIPNFNVINEYGPTENTVCTTQAQIIRCNNNTNIGRPISNTRCYVLDRDLNPLPTGAIGELYIGGVGLARGYLNQPELTAERFIDNPFQTEKEKTQQKNARLYKTGDLVRWCGDGNLEYIGRNDFQVKIRGYRIELGEIESALSSYDGIKQSVVLAKDHKDSDGKATENKYLVGYYVSEGPLDTQKIQAYLQTKMPDYMVPSAFVHLEELPLTINGKLDRKALPDPSFTNQKTYVAPRNELERRVVEIWAEVLGLSKETLGIQDDFFRVGGDSIISIQVVSRLRQRLKLLVSVRDIFSYKTIERLYDHVLSKHQEEGSRVDIKREEGILEGDVPLLPIQEWFFENDFKNHDHWNQSFLIKTPKLDIDQLKASLKKLVEHHDGFRLRYKKSRTEGSYVQYYDALASIEELKTLDIRALKGKEGTEEFELELQDILTDWQSCFHIERGPLYNIGYLYGYKDGSARLYFALHHLIVDTVSWRVLTENLKDLYSGKALGFKGSSYRQWTEAIKNYAKEHEEERNYWEAVLSDYTEEDTLKDLKINEETLSSEDIGLTVDQTKKLIGESNKAYHTEINDLLLTALGKALSKLTKSSVNHIILEGHGREEIDESLDITGTLGWFTTLYPVRLETFEDLGESLKNIKETLRQIPKKGIGYGSLIGYEKALPRISFNYLGQFDGGGLDEDKSQWSIVEENSGVSMHQANHDNNIININGLVINGALQFNLSTKFDTETTARLARLFKENLEEVTHYTTHQTRTYLTVSDVNNIIDQRYLDKIQSSREIEGVYKAGSLQQGFIYHALSQGDVDDAYRVQMLFEYNHKVDVERLKGAWESAQRKYSTLRLRFAWDEELVQIIDKEGSVDWRYIDLSGGEENAQDLDLHIKKIQEDDRRKVYDLARGCLFRVCLIKQKEDLYTCLFSSHHAILDGWSNPILLGYIHESYLKMIDGEMLVERRDYSYEASQKYLQEHEQDNNKYWEKYVSQIEERADLKGLLKSDQSTIKISEYKHIKETQEERVIIKDGFYDALKEVSQEEGVTLNAILQYAWHKALKVHGNSKQTVVGMTISGRSLPIDDVESSVGLYINTLPLIVDHKGERDKTIIESIKEIQENINEINSRSDINLARLHSGEERLFDCLFVYENYPNPEKEGGERLKLRFKDGIEKLDYPLSVTAYEENKVLVFNLSYAGEIFKQDKIKGLISTAKTILKQVGENPHAEEKKLSYLSKSQYVEIIERWNETDREYPDDKTIQGLFEEQVEKTPENIALIYEGIKLTYRELNERSNQLAHYILQNQAINPDTLIALCLDRSEHMVIGILAVLKAGAGYVPMDPSYPDSRIEYMLEDTNASIVLTNESHKQRLEGIVRSRASQLISRDEQFEKNKEVVEVLAIDDSKVQDLLSEQSLFNPETETASRHLAYVIYTSGTTGNPKGVMQSHGNVMRLFTATEDWYHFGSSDVWTLFHSYVFDFSVWEIWGALVYGGKLIIPSYEQTRDLSLFYELCKQEKVTVLNQTPSSFYQFAGVSIHRSKLTELKYIIFGGEALNLSQLKPWFDYYGYTQPKLINMYGITETTVHVTYKPIEEKDLGEQSYIGQLLPDLKAYVLDRDLNPLPTGAIGELYIGGVGLARGYLNQPELTAERFIDNPFQTEKEKTQQKNARLYKTGDLVRWCGDGNLEYIGRNDFQVKIRGYRIELGEIESALSSYDGIKQSVVLAKDHKDSDGKATENKYLVGYYVSKGPLDAQKIQVYLQTKMPDYMLPSTFVFLEELPLTINGKLDRKALPDPSFTNQKTYVAPRNELERRVVEIWAEVLGLSKETLGIQDDFFRVGGDSIISIQVVSRLRQRLKLLVSVRDIFSYKTIERLYDHVLSKHQEEGSRVDIKREEGILEGDVPLLPIQEWFFENDFKNHDHWNQSFLIKTPKLDIDQLKASLKKLVEHHDGFRLRYKKSRTEGSYVQYYDALASIEELKTLDIRALKGKEGTEEFELELQDILTDWQSCFHIERGPLYNIGYLYGYKDGSARLYFALHHLIVDTVSWRVLTENLKDLYSGKALGFKGSSYRQWTEAIKNYAKEHEEERNYWEAVLSDYTEEDTLKDLKINEETLSSEDIGLTVDQTKKLIGESNKAYHTEINDLLLTALGKALSKLTKSSVNHIILEGHGREEIDESLDITGTLGWFTTLYPVRLETFEDLGESLKNIKETLRQIPKKGIGYGSLIGYEKALPRISFNYLGQFDGGGLDEDKSQWSIVEENSGVSMHQANHDNNIININGLVINGALQFNLSTKFDTETTARLARLFKENLEKIIFHCVHQGISEYTTADFEDFEPYILFNKAPKVNHQSRLFLFPPGGGGAESYFGNIIPKLKNINLVAFNNYYEFLREKKEVKLLNSISYEKLACNYISYIKAIQTKGPYNLFGWSFGGVLTFEVARQLINRGDEVKNIFMVDSFFNYKMAVEETNIKTKEELNSINYKYAPLQYLETHNSNIILFKAKMPVDKDKISKYYTEKTVCNHLEFILKSNSNFRVVHINSDHNGWVDNEDEVIKICNIILDSTT